MIKKITLSTLAGFVVISLAGWLIMGFLFKEQMKELMEGMAACGTTEPNMLFMFLANLTLSLLFAILFYKMGIITFLSGLVAGIWISVLLLLWYDLWMFSSFNFMTLKACVFDVIGNAVTGGLAGGVMGLILGKLK